LLVSLALRERLRRLHEAAAAVGVLLEIHVLSLRPFPDALCADETWARLGSDQTWDRTQRDLERSDLGPIRLGTGPNSSWPDLFRPPTSLASPKEASQRRGRTIVIG
jgi:hypothetical protein